MLVWPARLIPPLLLFTVLRFTCKGKRLATLVAFLVHCTMPTSSVWSTWGIPSRYCLPDRGSGVAK